MVICIFPKCHGHDDKLDAILHGQQHLAAEVADIKRTLRIASKKEDKIMSDQDNIDAATIAVEGEVADLGTKDTQIQAVVTEILALQQAGVDTTALVAATTDLLTAQGADDAQIAALTAAANPAPATPAGE